MERTRRGTTPTPAGRLLVERSRTILADMDRADAAVRESLAGRRGRLRLGTTPTLGADLLPTLLGRLRSTHPDVAIDLRVSGDSPRLRSDVARGDLDAALAVVERKPRGATVALRGKQTFALVLPAGHELATGQPVHQQDLVGLPFVALPPGEGLRVLLDAVFTALDARPRIEIQPEDRELLVPLVAAGVGATLLPEGFARERATTDVAVTTLDPPVERPVGVVVPAGEVPELTAALVEAVAAVTDWT